MFVPILNQMVLLFAFIIVGFILSRCKLIPDNTATVLSKLENMIFMPALVMGTLIKNCTVEMLGTYWKALVLGVGLAVVLIPVSLVVAKWCFKENYLRKIAGYGLAFSNFGFMGNAIMQGAFGDEAFAYYIIYTLPIWSCIYLWAVPVLLIAGEEKKSFAQRLKSFFNPMLIAMIIGVILGLTGLGKLLPTSIISTEAGKSGFIDVAGACMSPIAMMLTGITIGKIDLLAFIKKWRIYVVSIVKLVVYPLAFIAVFAFIPQNSFINETFLISTMCVMCMPMGLNAIVIPAAYGKDTTDAAGMALITHAIAVGTIPLMFWMLQTFVL